MAATSRCLRTKNCHTRDVSNRLLQQLKPLAAEPPITLLTHPLAEGVEKMLVGARRLGAEERDTRLLRPRRERPRSRRAAKQRYELAASHRRMLPCFGPKG